MTITPLTSGDGEISHFIAIKQDITEQDRMQRLQSTLYRISQAANRARTPEDLYPFIHKIISESMPAKNFYIALYNEENDIIKPVYFIDEKDNPPPSQLLGKGLTAYVIKTAQPLLCAIEKFDELLAHHQIEEVGAPSPIWLGVPLISEEKTIGVMAVQHYQDEKAYGQEEKKILEIISSSVSSAISRQLAQAETRIYAETNALLYQASQQLSESLSSAALYKSLYHLISTSMDCDTLILSSYDKEKELIYSDFIIHEGEEQDLTAIPPTPLNVEVQGTESLVIRSGKPLISNDFIESVENAKINGEKSAQSLLITPLKSEGEVIGVVQVMSYKNNAYSQYHLNFLGALSLQISLSINNAKLFQQAQEDIKLRTQAETQLQEVNITLEERVEKRTNQLKQRVDMVEKLNLSMTNLLNDLNATNAIAEKNAHNLEQANTELEAFTHSVSHDLRAPLRHIEGFSRLLNDHLKETLDETSRQYIEHIIASTERMRNLIEDLLTLSRTNRADLHLKPLNLNVIIDSVRAQLFDEVSGREIVWKLAPLPSAQADAGLIKILWENLIGNAVKYTRPREEAIIEIGVSPSEGQPVYFIRDNGVGFAPEYKEQLFNVFQRLHKREEFEGSGVGLTTVKRIVERHGGKIWSEGKVGHGATFYFSLGKQ